MAERIVLVDEVMEIISGTIEIHLLRVESSSPLDSLVCSILVSHFQRRMLKRTYLRFSYLIMDLVGSPESFIGLVPIHSNSSWRTRSTPIYFEILNIFSILLLLVI